MESKFLSDEDLFGVIERLLKFKGNLPAINDYLNAKEEEYFPINSSFYLRLNKLLYDEIQKEYSLLNEVLVLNPEMKKEEIKFPRMEDLKKLKGLIEQKNNSTFLLNKIVENPYKMMTDYLQTESVEQLYFPFKRFGNVDEILKDNPKSYIDGGVRQYEGRDVSISRDENNFGHVVFEPEADNLQNIEIWERLKAIEVELSKLRELQYQLTTIKDFKTGEEIKAQIKDIVNLIKGLYLFREKSQEKEDVQAVKNNPEKKITQVIRENPVELILKKLEKGSYDFPNFEKDFEKRKENIEGRINKKVNEAKEIQKIIKELEKPFSEERFSFKVKGLTLFKGKWVPGNQSLFYDTVKVLDNSIVVKIPENNFKLDYLPTSEDVRKEFIITLRLWEWLNNSGESGQKKKPKDPTFLKLFRSNEERVDKFFEILKSKEVEALDKNNNWVYNNRKSSVVACFTVLEDLGIIKKLNNTKSLRRVVESEIKFEGNEKLFRTPTNLGDILAFEKIFKENLL